ncbi:hypothetical protein GUA36_20280 [Vibrio parahaemolyticus]|nr:hypothetical protein [Vibrio parahaemolyticus]EGQ8291404.1 hypothetical protein [Vibrio parahaemolyticus]EGQ8328317.1 hypothetical protein [Vibrio parahaemolyticus]EGQ8355066.1 hypothetical protein [Vibrio parahaemolyticus]EGQ8777767.1 hypothetical protein [Vibrio parahaemolyticus]
MPVKKNKRKKKANKSGKNRTSLLEHKKVGSELQPGFAQLSDRITFSSWSNERLPEMLWAAVIRVMVNQDYAINEFRRVIEFVGNHKEKEIFSDLSMSNLAQIEEELREEFISFLVENPLVGQALTVLKLFEKLPARESWLKYLPQTEPDVELLMAAIGMCLPHQSQEATDCRWLRLMLMVVSGKMKVPREIVSPWFKYPYDVDLTIVRPSIRSSEISLDMMKDKDSTWADNFWAESWDNTPCLELVPHTEQPIEENCCSVDDIDALREQLEKHWLETHTTTDIDAKHDGVFGVAFYALSILKEISTYTQGAGILSRLGLRTILEAHISLRYLCVKDDVNLWKKWRTYGAGQAKLNALKFDELVDAPKFINTETLESIAGEDIWEEFVNIELGSWSGADLRKLSEKVGLKPSYDKFYSWSSTYSHATWGAIREVCFCTCGNPLHRLHRYPKEAKLPATLHDACLIVNGILDDLDNAYPTFDHRLPE